MLIKESKTNLKQRNLSAMSQGFNLRAMKLSDISDAMHLSTAEGWNQTENDWKLLIENSENISLLAESGKKVIGTTTAINYSNDVAWIGMVLVDREFRGLGVSKLLLTDVLDKLKSCKLLKLDATPAGQLVYEKFGFKKEYFIERMVNQSLKNLSIDEYDTVPEAIRLNDIGEIVALDEIIFGSKRQQLIEYLVNQYPGKGWKLKRDNKIAGFVLGRDGSKYHHVGPVVASTIVDAEILILKSLEGLGNQPVVVDVLYDKSDLIKWLNSGGFIKQRHFIRMYKDQNQFPGIIDKQYLICGPEFG